MTNNGGRPLSGPGDSGTGGDGTRPGRTILLGAGGAAAAALAATFILLMVTRRLVDRFLVWAPERRRPLLESPADHGLASEDVQVVTQDGLLLHGWYVPGVNGATIMVQHGLPGGRQDGLLEAAFLNERGYNVLMGSFRAHDECQGTEISYGHHEMKDFKAWHDYLLGRAEVDPTRIGIFGQSVGGAVAIRYAAENPSIAAVASASAPALLLDALAHIITWELPLPAWCGPPLARLAMFWAQRKFGCPAQDIECLPYAARISPRPLLILQGGNDNNVPAEHGRLLYEAAGQPKEFWFVPEAGHVDFERYRPVEYRRRVLAFFDRYLPGQKAEG